MAPYIPGLADLTGLAGLAVTLALFLVLGSVGPCSRLPPEARIVAGWGAMCLTLTIWGIATPASLRVALIGLCLFAVIVLLIAGRAARGSAATAMPSAARQSCAGLGRAAILSLPFWIALLPAMPSQVDTWLNLLPNAAYLFDQGVLPRHDRPPAWSFLPVAPYNTQFAVFSASVMAGHLIPNGLALFNLALLVLAGLLIARVLADDMTHPPPWWAMACGLALVIPLNPGFVPRSFLSGYGETPQAVTALFAVWFGGELLGRLAARSRTIPRIVTLALILAAMVNTKQSGIGLLLAIGITFLTLAVSHPAIGWRRGLAVTAAVLTPALTLYLLWRGYASIAFEAGELRARPMQSWNFSLLPTILGSMLREIVQKATLYLCLLAVLSLAVAFWRRAPWSEKVMLLMLIGGTVVLYNGFLLFTYLAHFPPEMARNAHSYFRYSSHLSLMVMLGLTVALRPAAELGVLWLGARARPAGIAAVALMAVFPLAAIPLLRFDLQVPQPAIFALGPRIAALVPDGARLAVVVPSDPFDAAGSILRGVLLYLEPRRPALDLLTVNRADPDTLGDLQRRGAGFALLSCVRAPLESAGPTADHVGKAALLRATDTGWNVLEAWSWPPEHATARFGALLERPVFCAD